MQYALQEELNPKLRQKKHVDGVLYLNKVTSIETLLDIP